jgi:molybdopterin synthase catalytic subunit
MDYLKTRAPFWKKVELASGAAWVGARDRDDAAAVRWNKRARNAAE